MQTPTPDPLSLFLKTVVFYLVLVLVMRIMGKREIASLSPLDLVVTIMIADAAIIAIEEDNHPLWVGLIPVFTIAAGEMLLSYLMLKSLRFRAWVAGKPSIIINRGRIDEGVLRSLRLNLDELLSQLRQSNVATIQDVEWAILEPTGKMSVILKATRRPVIPDDMGLKPPQESLPQNLVVDGAIDDDALTTADRDRMWLMNELKKQGFPGPEKVLLASLDGQGSLTVIKKAAAPEAAPRP